MKTSVPPPSAHWYLLDAAGKPLGRLAAKVAAVLQGKNQVSYAPHRCAEEHVVVVNVGQVVLTGKKEREKIYVHHTGYVGHLRREAAGDRRTRRPEEFLRSVVSGMLPRNRLRSLFLQHLHLYRSADHPHAAQQPVPFPLPIR